MQSATQQPNIWAALDERIDPAQYRPCAVTEIAEEQVREGEQVYTVLRSARGNYVRLSPEQRDLWHNMDGTRTVAQLATQAFLATKQLLPVGDLVATLREEGFLIDQPISIYTTIKNKLEARTAEGWGKRIIRLLTGARITINQIDGAYGMIYRAVGWVLFTPVFVAIWLLVVIVGLAAFILLLVSQGSLVDGSVPTQIGTLWLVLLVSFLLHESGHALAVKHYRRTLGAGGIMLYFGAPAFFVDTSDIWRSPRRARIIVSAAGPMVDMFVGSCAALYALLQPSAPLAPIAAKLAFTCFIATLFNANPLLALDGYYILVDLLRFPNLRQRALTFVRGPLWAKMRQWALDGGWWKQGEAHTPQVTSVGRRSFIAGRLSRDERILTLYGMLSIFYSVVALWFAWQFWRRWLGETLVDLWQRGWLGQLVAAAIAVLVIAPIVLAVGLAAFGMVRGTVHWLIRRGYGRRPDVIAGVSTVVILGLALVFGRGEGVVYGAAVPLGLWGIATVAIMLVRPDYRGATIAPAMLALISATILAGSASLARALLPDTALCQWADGGALLLLLLAAFVMQLDVSVRMATPRVQFGSALLLIGAFSAGGLVLIERLGVLLATEPGTALAQAAPAALLIAAPVYFGTVALALMLPYLFSLTDSRLVWSWALLWLAVLSETLAYAVDLRAPSLGLDVLASGLWAAAWITQLATLRQVAPVELPWQPVTHAIEQERLQRAFQLCYAGCYRLLRAVYGAQRTRGLDDRMDVLAATANWDVRLDRDQAEIGGRLAAQPLDVQGERFAEVLRYTVATIEDIGGSVFARRTIQAAYDALPWPERETAGRLCFPDTPWARDLSAAFGDARQAKLRLLHDVDLLADLDDAALLPLVQHAHEIQVRAGEVVFRASEEAHGLWIVEAGEIVCKYGEHDRSELHRAAVFGAAEWAGIPPENARYIASIDATLLFLPSKALHGYSLHASTNQHFSAMLRLLEHVPVFAHVSRPKLQSLARIATVRHFAPREQIIYKGVATDVMHIVEDGRAVALVRSVDANGEHKLKIVHRFERGDMLGEVAQIEGQPPHIHVLAMSALTTIMLPHAAVRALARE